MLIIADSGIEHTAPRKEGPEVALGNEKSYDGRRGGNDTWQTKPIRSKKRATPHSEPNVRRQYVLAFAQSEFTHEHERPYDGRSGGREANPPKGTRSR